jgi:hypothetical protein
MTATVRITAAPGMIFTGVVSLLSLDLWLVVKGFRPSGLHPAGEVNE